MSKSNPILLFLLCIYSCALLIDHGIHWNNPKSTILLALLVVIQMFNYKTWWCSVFAVIIGLYITLPLFPKLANHTNISIGISIVLLFLIARKVVFKKSLSAATVSSSFRWILISLYFWAGFHKLNSGFFDIAGSCSVYINQYVNQLLFGVDFVPSISILRVSQIGTIVIEMIIPFGLLFHKTRKVAALILVVFHFYLALCNFTNFSAFAAFLILGSILDLRHPVTRNIRLSLLVYQGFCVLTVVICFGIKKYQTATDQDLFLLYSNIIFSIGWAIFFILFFKKFSIRKENAKPNLLQVSCVILISLWAIQCYVGLSTSGTLTMFSNLITEKSRTNHFLINTKKSKIWGFEEDYVSIIEYSGKENMGKKYDLLKYDIPLVEFKNTARKWTRNKNEIITCKLIYNGKIIFIPNLKHSQFICKEAWWESFITYRGIPKDGVKECLW
jgi:hypothetical protein